MKHYEELIFALQDIDPITGVSYFNGCSNTYYMEEEGELGYPKVMAVDLWKHWYKNDKFVFNWLINTPFHDCVTYKKISDIQENERYFYMINFFNVEFVASNKNIGFKCIPARVLEDVRENKCHIVLHCSTEAYSGCDMNIHRDDLDIIQDWIDQANIPSSNVVYINGNLISNSIKSSKVKYQIEGLCVMDGWIQPTKIIDLSNYNVIDFKPNNTSCLYLNLTREPRPHRVYLLSSLIANDLFDHGKNSFNMLYAKQHNGNYASEVMHDINNNFNPTEALINGAKYLDSRGKQFIDIDNTDMETAVKTSNKAMYEQTLLSIITETIVVANTVLISEKTWKSVAVGHPFMILGSTGTLKELKKMGYKTFDQWIDESYDDAITIVEKVEIICKNIQKLKDMSLDELIKIRNEMKDICIFNQKHFVSELNRKYYINNTFLKHKPVLDILQNLHKRSTE